MYGRWQPIVLTHWGRVTHICVSKLTIIGSDNGLSPCRRQAIIRTNDGILLIRTLGTNFSEILSEIHSVSFRKMHLKMSSAKWRLFCLGLNELRLQRIIAVYVLRWTSVHSGWYGGLLGLYLLNGKTSYRDISWRLEAAKLGVIMIVPFWNLTGISAVLLPRCPWNLRAISKV